MILRARSLALFAAALPAALLGSSPRAQTASLPTVWNRAAEYVPLQNPHADTAGNLVWSYQTHRSNRPSGAVWSPAWGGWQSGGSARFSGAGLMNEDGITAWLLGSIWKCWYCVIMESTFTNTTSETFDLRIQGTARLSWFDVFSAPVADAPGVVKVLYRPAGGHIQVLFDQTYSKPGGGTGSGAVSIPLDLGTLRMAPGDKIYTQVYGLSSSGGHNTWLRLDDTGIDYVRVVRATETTRRASPPNPRTLSPGATSGPRLGTTWDPSLDAPSGSPGTVLGLGFDGPQSLSTPLGTFLCNPQVFVSGSAGVPFAIPLPSDPRLLGVTVCTQAAALDAAGGLTLSNALDVVLGNG